MAELASRSGVARETIHFYLREGLLPRPEKGGRTVAYYGAQHLERLRIIRRLREEKYLPIAVIRRLLESPAAAERDVDVLADVLHIIPADDEGGAAPSEAAMNEAVARGLLGPQLVQRAAPSLSPPSAPEPESEPQSVPSSGLPSPSPIDPATRRVLGVIDEALALDGAARKLTLDDLGVCATALTALVAHEASLFFDTMFESGDAGGAIAALRAGRPPVARFITAYRDLMLRRIVEEVLLGLEQGPDMVLRAATIPLSPEREAELGVADRRATLWRAWNEDHDEGAASRLVWHLFGTGAAAELASLPPDLAARAGRRLAPLCAWGALENGRSSLTLAALDRAVATAPEFALGQILLGEAEVARGVRRRQDGASVLEQAIPALHRVFAADPDRDPEPFARAFGWFHRGRVELSAPSVLGRKERGLASLERALAVLDDAGASIEPAAQARLAANAHLALGRHFIATGDVDRGKAALARAAAIDPDGTIGRVAREEMG